MQNGIPHVTSKLKPIRPNVLGAINKSWEQSKAFDSESCYEANSPEGLRLSLIKRVLAYTVYNPPLDIEVTWRRSEDSSIDQIISEVEDGLKHDDDIIQQWFGASEVMILLRSATNFEELCDRIECICGGFEDDARLQKIVNDTLKTKM